MMYYMIGIWLKMQYIMPLLILPGIWIRYQPTKVSENSKVTTDYNAIKDIWMESYKGAIFEAGYGAGSYNSNGQSGGRLMQNGCRYLVEKKNKTFYDCVHYYYDNSTASQGGAVRFFDSDKNEINK